MLHEVSRHQHSTLPLTLQDGQRPDASRQAEARGGEVPAGAGERPGQRRGHLQHRRRGVGQEARRGGRAAFPPRAEVQTRLLPGVIQHRPALHGARSGPGGGQLVPQGCRKEAFVGGGTVPIRHCAAQARGASGRDAKARGKERSADRHRGRREEACGGRTRGEEGGRARRGARKSNEGGLPCA